MIRPEEVMNDDCAKIEKHAGDSIDVFDRLLPTHYAVKYDARVRQSSVTNRRGLHCPSIRSICCPQLRVQQAVVRPIR